MEESFYDPLTPLTDPDSYSDDDQEQDHPHNLSNLELPELVNITEFDINDWLPSLTPTSGQSPAPGSLSERSDHSMLLRNNSEINCVQPASPVERRPLCRFQDCPTLSGTNEPDLPATSFRRICSTSVDYLPAYSPVSSVELDTPTTSSGPTCDNSSDSSLASSPEESVPPSSSASSASPGSLEQDLLGSSSADKASHETELSAIGNDPPGVPSMTTIQEDSSSRGKEENVLPLREGENTRKRKPPPCVDDAMQDKLEHYFSLNQRPLTEEMADVAKAVKLDMEIVQSWFSHRRQREKQHLAGILKRKSAGLEKENVPLLGQHQNLPVATSCQPASSSTNVQSSHSSIFNVLRDSSDRSASLDRFL